MRHSPANDPLTARLHPSSGPASVPRRDRHVRGCPRTLARPRETSMSTAAQPPAITPHPMATSTERSVTVVSHSNLFYWWPVWAVGFLMALLTYFDGHVMTTVPLDTKAVKKVD